MKKNIKKYIPYIILLIFMYGIHRYVQIYADDYYYSRDAQTGLANFHKYAIKELNTNGRVWVHILLMLLIKYDVLIFRIINPIVITLGAILIYNVSKKISSNKGNKYNKGEFIIGILVCMLFIGMPTEIVKTTLYYPACALNYLYPSIVSILWGYLIYNFYEDENNMDKLSVKLIIIGFLAGSSTQQAGMIAIGFSVINFIYLKMKKYKFNFKYYLNVISLFLGYLLVTYGSVKRMLFETSTGVEISLMKTLKELLKTNVFSKVISIYVILIIISFIFNIISDIYVEKNKVKKSLGYVHVVILAISSIVYAYVTIYRGHNISTLGVEGHSLIAKLYYIVFISIYIFYMIYCGIRIYIKKKNIFIMNCIINAIGAQVMMLVVDSRFASTYKIIFPSLMLTFVFIIYSFINFYNDVNIKLRKYIVCIIVVCVSIISLKNYYGNYIGYKETAVNIEYNLNAIKEYQKDDNKDKLVLKKVKITPYGYNLGNWNNMPYFMKQCYKINENTQIEYIESSET